MTATSVTRTKLWTARTVSGLAALFLLVDATVKVLQLGPAVQGTADLGYPANSVVWLGAVQLACIVLYLVPRTSVLGAILLTGYLGGAIASHVRVSNPLFSHVLFPTYVAALIWGGLYLRNQQLRVVLRVRRRA